MNYYYCNMRKDSYLKKYLTGQRGGGEEKEVYSRLKVDI